MARVEVTKIEDAWGTILIDPTQFAEFSESWKPGEIMIKQDEDSVFIELKNRLAVAEAILPDGYRIVEVGR